MLSLLKIQPAQAAWPGRGVALAQNSDRADRLRLEEFFRDLRTGSGVAIIAASGVEESAFEDEKWHNGVFTFALLSSLESGKADLNRDTDVRFSELRRYVNREVTRLTKGRQIPSVRNDPPTYDFTVINYAGTSGEEFYLAL